MIWRAPEAELIPYCSAHGISQIVWSPLAQGVLTGKYTPGEDHPEDSRAASDAMGWAMDRYLADEVLEAVQRLTPVADQAGLTLVDVASAIVGASRPEQVHANAKASGITLSADTLEAIDEALGGVIVDDPRLANFVEEGVKHR
jgi:aryl-alcohol dehydrogenase-like predicted oxidoreductase